MRALATSHSRLISLWVDTIDSTIWNASWLSGASALGALRGGGGQVRQSGGRATTCGQLRMRSSAAASSLVFAMFFSVKWGLGDVRAQGKVKIQGRPAICAAAGRHGLTRIGLVGLLQRREAGLLSRHPRKLRDVPAHLPVVASQASVKRQGPCARFLDPPSIRVADVLDLFKLPDDPFQPKKNPKTSKADPLSLRLFLSPIYHCSSLAATLDSKFQIVLLSSQALQPKEQQIDSTTSLVCDS